MVTPTRKALSKASLSLFLGLGLMQGESDLHAQSSWQDVYYYIKYVQETYPALYKAEREAAEKARSLGISRIHAFDIPYLQIKTLPIDARDEELEKIRSKTNEGSWSQLIQLSENLGESDESASSFRMVSKTDNGTSLYELSGIKGSKVKDKEVTVLFDRAKRTKTLFQYLNGSVPIKSLLSPKGNLLYLGLTKNIPTPAPEGAKGDVITYGDPNNIKSFFHLTESGGIYLIDLENSMRVAYHDPCRDRFTSLDDPQFSKDGNVFCVNERLFNVSTKIIRELGWHSASGNFDYVLSPDGNYVASRFGMFPSAGTVEGRGGIEVSTPRGNFLLSSPTISLLEKEIQNDGTIVDSRGYEFSLENDSYRCVKSPKDRPLTDLVVRKY